MSSGIYVNKIAVGHNLRDTSEQAAKFIIKVTHQDNFVVLFDVLL
jgi:hypothetical protein